MELNELIESMEKRTMMYMKDYSIDQVCTYIYAFMHGKKVCGKGSEKEDKFLIEFHDWVTDYYKAPEGRGWSGIILFYEGSHRAAVNKFFELYHEWYDNL